MRRDPRYETIWHKTGERRFAVHVRIWEPRTRFHKSPCDSNEPRFGFSPVRYVASRRQTPRSGCNVSLNRGPPTADVHRFSFFTSLKRKR